MKKFVAIISLLIIVIGIFIFCIPFLPIDVIAKFDSEFVIFLTKMMSSSILPLIVIYRSILLVQRDVKVVVAKIGLYFSLFSILILNLIAFDVITNDFGAGTISTLCISFLSLILIYTFIFELVSFSKSVTIYQYVVAFLSTILIAYLTLNSIFESLDPTSIINSIQYYAIVLLLIISIPSVNMLFDKEPKESNNIDMYLQDVRREKEKEVLNSETLAPILNPINTEKEVTQAVIPDAFNIPISTTPVSVNDKPNVTMNNPVLVEQPKNLEIPIATAPVSVNDTIKKEEINNNINPSL